MGLDTKFGPYGTKNPVLGRTLTVRSCNRFLIILGLSDMGALVHLYNKCDVPIIKFLDHCFQHKPVKSSTNCIVTWGNPQNCTCLGLMFLTGGRVLVCLWMTRI